MFLIHIVRMKYVVCGRMRIPEGSPWLRAPWPGSEAPCGEGSPTRLPWTWLLLTGYDKLQCAWYSRFAGCVNKTSASRLGICLFNMRICWPIALQKNCKSPSHLNGSNLSTNTLNNIVTRENLDATLKPHFFLIWLPYHTSALPPTNCQFCLMRDFSLPRIYIK